MLIALISIQGAKAVSVSPFFFFFSPSKKKKVGRVVGEGKDQVNQHVCNIRSVHLVIMK